MAQKKRRERIQRTSRRLLAANSGITSHKDMFIREEEAREIK